MDKFAELHARRAANTAQAQAVSEEIAALIGVPAQVPALADAGDELPELTAALRECTPRQRKVLKALAENDFVVKRSAAMSGETTHFVQAQLRKPAVAKAREILERMAAESLGITAASTLARINTIIELAMWGGEKSQAVALRGLETLAKATGAVPTGIGGGNVNVGVQVMVPVEKRHEKLADVPGIKILDAEIVG